jgi:hypothetical protein
MEQGREKTAWLHPPHAFDGHGLFEKRTSAFFATEKSAPKLFDFSPGPSPRFMLAIYRNLQELLQDFTGISRHFTAVCRNLQELSGLALCRHFSALYSSLQKLTGTYIMLDSQACHSIFQQFIGTYRNLSRH